MRRLTKIILILTAVAFSLQSCREDQVIIGSVEGQVTDPVHGGSIAGFYHLNEGNMGMNKASIDYFDYSTGIYAVNIYPERNPNVVKELGDVGNDIQIYGGKLYAVINASNKVEVMDVCTTKRIKLIDIPNCRYIVFNEGKAYVSSYAGPIAIDPNTPLGVVLEIDTATLETTRRAVVGYQPEEMVIRGNKLYVANSGGYRVPNYERTISVIDLDTFKEKEKIDVAINLHRMQIDKRGDIYVSSRGDYTNTGSKLYVIDTETDKMKQELDIPVSNMTMVGDSLYYIGVSYSHNTGKNTTSYGILDTRTKRVISDKIITDGTDKGIIIPYGIAVQPETKEIYISDAQNYIVSGYVYCFTPEGKLKWKVMAGNIPGHFAFVNK
ncbi:MAG: YncE family protein [Dysgonomonas sp.]